MKILAIETATAACSAALYIDGTCCVRIAVAPRQHAALILPMIDELLREADIKISDLDAIAFGQGPGAFTGVRIAFGVVQGLACAHQIPVIPVSTLAALAQQFVEKYDCVVAAIDARLQEVYWGLYQKNKDGLMQAIATETVCAPLDVSVPLGAKWFGVGSAWAAHPEELRSKCDQHFLGFDAAALPSAKAVIELAKPAFLQGKTVLVEAALPVYLRDKVVG